LIISPSPLAGSSDRGDGELTSCLLWLYGHSTVLPLDFPGHTPQQHNAFFWKNLQKKQC
jgi:hypothetical protein